MSDRGGGSRPERPDEGAVSGRLELAVRIAREAGELTLEHFRSRSLRVERKTDDTPVTAADRDAEALLRRRIGDAFPDDGVVGEEHDDRRGTSPYRWIVDPIDGTRSFVRGVPLYGTLVAVQVEGSGVEAGVIRLPALEETVYGARGRGAWHLVGESDPVPARVSERGGLGEALFLTTEVPTWRRRGAGAAYRRLEERSRLTRTWGDCYGYALVATGRAEVMVDPFLSLWDAAALIPVVEEAGGRFTDWTGASRPDGGDGVATNGRVDEAVLSVLAPFTGER